MERNKTLVKNSLKNVQGLLGDGDENLSRHKDSTTIEYEKTNHAGLQIRAEEHLSSEAKYHDMAEEYEELFEYTPVGYFILDKLGKIVKVNQRGTEQLETNKQDLIGKSFTNFLFGDAYKSNFFTKNLMNSELRKMHRIECEIRRNDGTVFSALVKSRIVKDEKNRFKHLLLIVSDISTIKQHEHQIETALTKEKELNEMKSRFIAMASHEFRTPLSSVLSSTALIGKYLEVGHAEKVKKHLLRIRSSVKDLTNILEEFLSLERLDNGKIEVYKRAFNLPEFCDDLVEEISPILKNGQHINYNHVGEELVVEDKKILQHVFLNLLSNACKYSGEYQGIDLATEVNGTAICIKVQDYGIGIPEEEQENLFSRFFRARNTESIQGTGLGLNIVKRYLELIDGAISYESKENEGTTFFVVIPKS